MSEIPSAAPSDEERQKESHTIILESSPTRKRIAIEFLEMVIAGNIDEAYERYVDKHGKHHNPSFAAGFHALKKGMIENHEKFPNKQISVKNILGDGDLVAVHSEIVMNPGDPGMIAIHLFRFQGDKIVELWDCGQSVPADSPNEDGAF